MTGCRNAEDGLSVEGYESRPGEQVLVVNNVVTPGYFETVGMRLRAGRVLDDRDRQSSPLVAVVNESFVRRYFGDAQPIGKRFGYTLNRQIVGIVENARVLNVKEEPEPMAFFSLQQRPSPIRSIEIRATGDPRRLASAVRQAIAETAPDLPIESVATLSERVSNNLSLERLLISLSAAFGALALGLAGLGLFGLLSYAVARRTADFGIRIALGAPQRVVLWGMLRESLLLSFAGVAIGLLLVLAASGPIRAVLYEVNPLDGATIFAATSVLVVVAALAGLLPAWRASRVDPLVALRQEA
jgi:predicted permease